MLCLCVLLWIETIPPSVKVCATLWQFLSPNFEKTWFIHFRTTYASSLDIQIGYHNKLISNTPHSKFIGITTKNILLWNTHLNQLITKLSRACYMIRTIKTFMLTDMLITVYHTCFYSLMSYGLIFRGSPSYGIKISWLQKKVIGIITGTRNRDSCRDYFKTLKMFPLQTQCLLFVFMFVVKKRAIQKYE